MLVGLALATFIAPGPSLWVYVVLGAAVSVVATLGTANALKPFGVAALTFPFVIVTWILLLATYGFSGLSGLGPPTAAVITPFEASGGSARSWRLHRRRASQISQVFLKAASSRRSLSRGPRGELDRAAAFCGRGASLAVTAAHRFGAESDVVVEGLLGFSPVLTAVALVATFHRPGLRVAAYAALGTIFTVVAQAALDVALRPFAVPALTAPFILVSWMFLLPRRSFELPGIVSGDTDAGAE